MHFKADNFLLVKVGLIVLKIGESAQAAHQAIKIETRFMFDRFQR